MRLGFRLAFAFFVSTFALGVATSQVVQTAEGKISGVKESNSAVVVYKGIPFAAAPIGDLRWRAPQPPTAWKSIRKATEFGASCMQVKAGERLPWTREFMVQNEISEDCLYLNVWTPNLKADANLPVILFIHGGGFTEGSGGVEIYDGVNLAAKGAVVVTINYRLGVFGFLAYPELSVESGHHSSGNYGLLDQIAALRWVKNNIANFGGNPKNITIWGQSAGAASVGDLIASPLAAGLFQHAQADSGLGEGSIGLTTLKDAEQNGVKFAGEHHAASVKELRALPAEALEPDPKAPMAGGMLRFSPNVDGWVLPDTPNNMNAKGTDNDVSVITGYNEGDAGMMMQRITSVDAYSQMVEKRYGEMAVDFKKLYPVQKVDEISGAMKAAGEDRNRVSAFLWASRRVKSHHSLVFIYYFDRGIPWPQHPEFGAFHSGELPYFFLNQKMLDRPWETVDFTLGNTVSNHLINFATN
jgi:para-nitrobenzyl esterase